MREPGCRLQRLVWLSLLLVVGCGRAARPPDTANRSSASRPASTGTATPSLYAAEEALRDALSGPLEYLGTGKWPGIQRMYACAFRNQRVIVVNAYCSTTEVNAFRVDVYSPTRGRVRIYAEADGPVSVRTRQEYFTFTAETEPPPSAEAGLLRPTLGMSFAELRAYDEQRYEAFLPACYGGMANQRTREGCLGPLAPRIGEWTQRNQSFLRNVNQDWYRLVRDLRVLAMKHGREPDS